MARGRRAGGRASVSAMTAAAARGAAPLAALALACVHAGAARTPPRVTLLGAGCAPGAGAVRPCVPPTATLHAYLHDEICCLQSA